MTGIRNSENWKKAGKETTILEVVERNTGISIIDFLNPARKPYLKGLDEAVQFIKEHNEIIVIGDYDADGVTSSAILYMLLKWLGKKVHIYIPKRFTDGYGISQGIIDRIPRGAIMTIDNGIAAVEVIHNAQEKGLDVFVVDHHLKRDDGMLPQCGLLDPHVDYESEFEDYCGAGLAYRIAQELCDDTVLLEKCLILASIGTVADVVPLYGDNRNIVKDGLEAINEGKATLGLQVLIEALNLEEINEGDYGFKLGPIINASGRLQDNGPMEVLRLLVYDPEISDPTDEKNYKATACNMAQILINRNNERKDLVSREMDLIRPLIDEKQSVKVVYHESLSQGIIGILAGKISEETHCPAIVFTDDKNGILKGSGRSETEHLKFLLDKVSAHILKYGGHEGAAGLSIKKEKLDTFTEAVNVLVAMPHVDATVPVYDLEIDREDIEKTIRELSFYAPYGQGNPQIRFLVKGIEMSPQYNGAMYRSLGQNGEHLKLKSGDVDYLLFDMMDQYEKDGFPDKIDCIGTPGYHVFRGKNYPQMEVSTYAPAGKDTVSPTEEKSMDDYLASLLLYS